MTRTRAPYGSWPSPISAERLTQGVRGYAELRSEGDSLFWVESRPDEGGRAVLVRWNGESRDDLTPPPFNVRSRVHEYGGGAYVVDGGTAFFVNFADQNIYRLDLTSSEGPVAVTAGDASERFADFRRHDDCLVAVRERHTDDDVVNDLVQIEIATGDVRSIHTGHDFYSSPRFSNDGRLAFVAWDHPNMPWDGTQLFVAQFSAGALGDAIVVAGGVDESVVNPTWCDTPEGARLCFASDETGFWNLYAYDQSGVYPMHQDEREYASPAWAFGMTSYVPMGRNVTAARVIDNGEHALTLIDSAQGLSSPVEASPYVTFNSLTAYDGRLVFVAGSTDRHAEIVSYDFVTGEASPLLDEEGVDLGAVSVGESIAFPTRLGEAYAYIYPPENADFEGETNTLPPLLVLSHGGPTGSTARSLSLAIQYYTSRGWAVADVNYGGSTGFGRQYRERLNANWGIVDVEDCVACARFLMAEGRVDPTRIAIKGGSAGGFTTLAALTTSPVFKAGSSLYGVGDLRALARDTHKFESRYLDGLIGSEEALDNRSPINHVDRLQCPIIFLQGSEDRVVPPNQSEAMCDALRKRGIPTRYVLFDGEGHGFRRAENVQRAIQEEYAFFARIFDIALDTLPAGFTIENLD